MVDKGSKLIFNEHQIATKALSEVENVVEKSGLWTISRIRNWSIGSLAHLEGELKSK